MPKTVHLSKESQFIDRLKYIYPANWEDVVKCHTISHPKTFRINTLKTTDRIVISSLAEQGFEIVESDIKGAYICLNDDSTNRLSDTQESKSMQIYIQELSSMIPALLLDLKVGDKVLDLCAAPGSKTTQIADSLDNKGEIVANEQSRDRFFKLLEIVKGYGARVKVVNDNGKVLCYKYPEYVQYFDKLLVDVPCTNEASLDLGHTENFKFWKSSNSSDISKLQKGLLASAISMLKPGGTLVYSTCTYAVEENEGVVDWALGKFSEVELEEIHFEKVPQLAKVKNYVPGLTRYKNKEFDKRLSRTIRILPNKYFKGFYMAKFTKGKVG